MHVCFLVCLLALIHVQPAESHARLWEPPSRNTAWRRGFQTPEDYTDHGYNCGFKSQSFYAEDCGVCGDPSKGPLQNERPNGKFAKDVIVRKYQQGSTINIEIQITANHKGFMEVRICPVTNPSAEVTKQCLAQNILQVAGGSSQYPIETGMTTASWQVQLPAGLTCSHCVIQWRYRAGNNWGTDKQEEFYACADVAILSSGAPPPPTIAKTTTTTTTTKPATTTTTTSTTRKPTTPTIPTKTTTTAKPTATTTAKRTTTATTTTTAIIQTTPTTAADITVFECKVKPESSMKNLQGIEKWCALHWTDRSCIQNHCDCATQKYRGSELVETIPPTFVPPCP